MKMVSFELKKLCAGNIKWLFLMLVLLNALVYFMSIIPAMPSEESKELRSKWERAAQEQGEDFESRRAFLEEMSEALSNIHMYLAHKDVLRDEEIAQTLELYGDSPYMQENPDDVFEESMAVAELLEEYETAGDYEAFINNMEERAEKMLSVPIFAKSKFSRSNIEKTVEDFADVRGLAVTPLDDTGIRKLHEFYLSDIFILAVVCLFCFQEFGYDSKSGMGNLIQATPRGRTRLRLAQTGAIWIAAVTAGLLFYGGNILQTLAVFGTEDLGAYVQGIASLKNVSFPCTVGMYLALYLAGKLLAILVIAGFCQFLAVKLNGAKAAWAIYGAAVGASFLLWFLIPDSPAVKLFRYLNLVGILDMKQIVGNYQNLNVFSIPISLTTAALVLGGAVLALCVGLSLTVSKTSLQLPACLTERRRKRRRAGGGVLGYEWSKLMRNQKIWVVFAALVVLAGSGFNLDAQMLQTEEFYYRQYLAEYRGDYTQEKQETFAAVYEEGAPDSDRQNALERLNQQFQGLAALEDENLGVVDLTELDGFFSDTQTEAARTLMVAAALALSLSALFYQDGKQEMNHLFCSMPKGNRVFWCKLSTAALLGALYAAAAWAFPCAEYFLGVGVTDAEYSIRSIPEFAQGTFGMPIGTYMAVTIFLRLLVGAYLGILTAFFAQFFEQPIQNLICTVLVFLLPLCLCYIEEMGYENALVNFIKYNLSFATVHVKVLSGIQRSCDTFTAAQWAVFAAIPAAAAAAGRLKWTRRE